MREVKSGDGGIFRARAVTSDYNGAFVFFFKGLLFAFTDEVGCNFIIFYEFNHEEKGEGGVGGDYYWGKFACGCVSDKEYLGDYWIAAVTSF
jgi:hypothetical protein